MDKLRKKKRKYQEELTLLQRKESVTKHVKKCRDKKQEVRLHHKLTYVSFYVRNRLEVLKNWQKEEVNNKDVTEIEKATTAVDDKEVKKIEKVVREFGEPPAARGQATEQEKKNSRPSCCM